MNKKLYVYKIEKLDKKLPNTAGLDFDFDGWWKQEVEEKKHYTTKDHIVLDDFAPVGSIWYNATDGYTFKILALSTTFEEVE